MDRVRKLFGRTEITWKRLIIFAVIAGVYTGIVAMLPFTQGTSFADISMTFEWWVLFGIILIMNGRTPLDSALKCLVFFLISQPLVYLVQVPFNPEGFRIFRFYPDWFVWTLFTFPMGFIGHYMKKDKWWGLLILTPMLLFVGYMYQGFLGETIAFFPRHLLSAVFCVVTVLLYPLVVFNNKKIRTAGAIIAVVIIIVMTVIGLNSDHSFYNTTILRSGNTNAIEFDGTYTAELQDEEYGKVRILYDEDIDSYRVYAEFEKAGDTELILTAPDGEKTVFTLHIEQGTYTIAKQNPSP